MTSEFPRRFRWSGTLLGFSLGGFFDGILLHQILQWHHLLSAVEGAAFRDIRVQVLADGLFHALMYLVAAVGLVLLWRSRSAFAAPGGDRQLLTRVMIGFGAWHVADALLSHWILAIHRIRMDAPNPLMWDVTWLAVFGILPLIAGWYLQRGGTRHDGRGSRGPVAATLVALAVVAAAAASLRPPANLSQVVVYFGPWIDGERVIAAAAAVDGRLVWSEPSGQLWVLALPDPSRAATLYRHGALFVGSSLVPIGCAAWARAS